MGVREVGGRVERGVCGGVVGVGDVSGGCCVGERLDVELLVFILSPRFCFVLVRECFVWRVAGLCNDYFRTELKKGTDGKRARGLWRKGDLKRRERVLL